MKNSADQSGCYELKPKAEVDNTLWGLWNSSYVTKAKFALLFIQNIKGENELFVFFAQQKWYNLVPRPRFLDQQFCGF